MGAEGWGRSRALGARVWHPRVPTEESTQPRGAEPPRPKPVPTQPCTSLAPSLAGELPSALGKGCPGAPSCSAGWEG